MNTTTTQKLYFVTFFELSRLGKELSKESQMYIHAQTKLEAEKFLKSQYTVSRIISAVQAS